MKYFNSYVRMYWQTISRFTVTSVCGAFLLCSTPYRQPSVRCNLMQEPPLGREVGHVKYNSGFSDLNWLLFKAPQKLVWARGISFLGSSALFTTYICFVYLLPVTVGTSHFPTDGGVRVKRMIENEWLLPVCAGRVLEEPGLTGDWLVCELKRWKELVWSISYKFPPKQSQLWFSASGVF